MGKHGWEGCWHATWDLRELGVGRQALDTLVVRNNGLVTVDVGNFGSGISFLLSAFLPEVRAELYGRTRE